MFCKAMQRDAQKCKAFDFYKRSISQEMLRRAILGEERSEMWFALPQTSRKGAGGCPLEPLRTHALCEQTASMGRPTKSEKRDRQLNLKLTARELDWVRARAAKAGMRAVDFARAQLFVERRLRASRRPQVAHLDPLFIAQVSRIGNNLNQMTRSFHRGQISAPAELGPLLQAIRDVVNKGAGDGS
jgi:hypothetical protein